MVAMRIYTAVVLGAPGGGGGHPAGVASSATCGSSSYDPLRECTGQAKGTLLIGTWRDLTVCLCWARN